MDPQKTLKKLKKELLRSPAKSAGLGIGLLVALYFWAPLAMGWLGWSGDAASPPKPPAGGAKTAAVPASQPAAEKPPADAPKKSPQEPTWKEQLALRENDPFTHPVRWSRDRRNPFQIVKPPEPEPPADAELAVQTEAEAQTQAQAAQAQREAFRPTAENLGLILQSTIVGPRQRTARINGFTYRQGDWIDLTPDGYDALPASEDQPAGAAYLWQISDITPQGATLRSGEYTVELEIQRGGAVRERRIVIRPNE